jgi:hypothetical protein
MKSEFSGNFTSGFSVLGLMAAVSVGGLLTLGYANLSHYLIAQNALEQSTRAALRCVVPTNGDCFLESSSEPQKNQWRYFASRLVPRGDIIGSNYDYSARIFRQSFSTESTYYSIPQEEAPKVEITTYKVPAARYIENAAFKRVSATFVYDGIDSTSVALPRSDPFPRFEAKFENDHINYSFDKYSADSGNRWVFSTPYQTDFSIRLDGSEAERSNQTFTRRLLISPTTSIQLSRLIGNESSTERCDTGKVCNVSEQSGDSGNFNKDSYLEFRHLALYLEIKLKSKPQNTEFGIEGVGNTSGLKLLIAGGSKNERVCLGGREKTKLNSLPGGNFNLMLRGIKNSSGGGLDNRYGDLDCDGNYRLNNLRIPIGGSFKPEIGLVFSGKSGDRIEGQVILHVFVDRYDSRLAEEKISRECQPAFLKRGKSLSEILPSPPECGLHAKTKIVGHRLIRLTEQQAPCSAPKDDVTFLSAASKLPDNIAESFVVEEKLPEPNEILHPLCQASHRPDVSSECGWTLVPDSEQLLEIGTLDQMLCPESQKHTEIISCNEALGSVPTCSVENLDLNRCHGVIEKKKVLEKQGLAELAVTLGSNDFQKSLIRGVTLPPKLSCSLETLPGGKECGVVSKKIFHTSELFQREDPSWRPTEASSYIQDGPEPLCGEIASEKVVPGNFNSSPIEITGFPFDGSETVEISDYPPVIKNGKIECDTANGNSVSLESRLRKYAEINGFSAAIDPTIKFEFESTPLNSNRLISSSVGCRTSQMASANQCSKLSAVNYGVEECGEETDLGVSDSIPLLCQQDSISCRKVPVQPVLFASTIEHSSEESVRLAETIGTGLLKTYFPQASAESISFDVSLNFDKTVSVTGSYQMPLTWPLKDLLGREFLRVSKTKSERVEAIQ